MPFGIDRQNNNNNLIKSHIYQNVKHVLLDKKDLKIPIYLYVNISVDIWHINQNVEH